MKVQVLFDIADFCEIIGIFIGKGYISAGINAKTLWEENKNIIYNTYLLQDEVEYIIVKNSIAPSVEVIPIFRDYIKVCKKSVED